MLTSLIEYLGSIIVAVISATGYFGVLVLMTIESACIPLPSEITMPFAGYLVSRGELSLIGVALAGAHTVVVPTGVPGHWVSAVRGRIVPDEPALSHAQLDEVSASLTGCAVAIAETGTIVLDGGPTQGRRAITLLPDTHVVVVDGAQVVPDVGAALRQLDARRPQTWVSGPSATSGSTPRASASSCPTGAR